MGSHPIFKTIDEYTQQQFKAYKTWTFTESTIGQYRSSVNEGIYVSHSVIVDTSGYNASGLSKRSLFDSVYRMYYEYPNSPFDSLGGNSAYQDRDISKRVVVVSIANDYIGEGIKPGSISITDNSTGSIVITDDGFGNLMDTTINTTSSIYVSSESLCGHWSFNEGFVTINGSTSNLASVFENRNHVYGNPIARMYGVTYGDGIYGTKVNLLGASSSFGIVDDYRQINFRTNEDFAVSLWVWIPPSQSLVTVADNMILEKWDGNGGYPFVVRVLNQTDSVAADRGKVYCATYDGNSSIGLSSTNALNDGKPHHIVYQRTGQLYELYVDSASNASATKALGQTHNNSPLYIGTRGYPYSPTGTIYHFSGSVDEIRIYSGSLNQSQIDALYNNPSNTNIVGNVFYGHGILALTNLSGSYGALMLSGSEFVMKYKSTVTITENSILATVLPSEFNMTMNPSAATVYDVDDIQYMSLVTGSEWSPYITTMGLYDDNLNLLAVAKFAKPIKKPTDAPITFAIRWDS